MSSRNLPIEQLVLSYNTHTHTHPFNGPLSGSTQVSRYQKVKPIWILLKQETVRGSGISWATTQFFTGRMPFLPPNQQRQSTAIIQAVNIPVNV